VQIAHITKLITDFKYQKLCEFDTRNSTLETCKGTEVNTVGKRVSAFNNTLTEKIAQCTVYMPTAYYYCVKLEVSQIRASRERMKWCMLR